MPFFTVIIPTRNRPDLVLVAVQSVLEQDFRDFEVIVSDNSDEADAEATRAGLLPMLSDPRLRYVRPERVMPVTEHWEWVTRQAEGQFTGILQDRMTLRLYALQQCWEALQAYPLDVVCFRGENLARDTPPYTFRHKKNPSGVRICDSRAVLADCARSKVAMGRLPRMVNAFCQTKLLHRLVEEYGSIYTGFAPDLAVGFRLLDSVESFVSLDDRLLVSGNDARSNGLALIFNRPNRASLDFLAKSGDRGWFAHAPIGANVPISANFTLLEYEVAREQQRSGRFQPFDKAEFYHRTEHQLRRLIREGHDVAVALDALEAYRTEHDIPPSPPAFLDRIRRQRLIRSMRLSRIARAVRALGPYLQAGLAAATGRPGPLNMLRGFPTVIELLRYDAATAAQTRG